MARPSNTRCSLRSGFPVRIVHRNVGMDLRKLKKLIDLVSESDISELEITEGDDHVRIAKATPGTQTVAYIPEPPAAAAAAVAAAPAAEAAPAPAAKGHVVK